MPKGWTGKAVIDPMIQWIMEHQSEEDTVILRKGDAFRALKKTRKTSDIHKSGMIALISGDLNDVIKWVANKKLLRRPDIISD